MLRNGKILRGVMTARTRHDVIVKLKKTRVQPIAVKSRKKLLVSESKKKIDQKKLAQIHQDVEKQKSWRSLCTSKKWH